ncbi:MAG TPA: SAM-dependent methyltransferase [Actinocrinis sp.]|nr:SAM-dependent methyltransferase [Actinocrinis sp.]
MPEGDPPITDDPPILGEGLLEPGWAPELIDTATAHPARMYDYYLGGKDNYQVDRDAAEEVMAIMPQTRMAARANRSFLGRAVRHLARLGVRQFLDIGTGIPGPGNTGEVAHLVAPDARVVYVDNDPIVLAHAEALLAKADRARTTVIGGDLRDPQAILANPRVADVLDFTEPIAVLLVAVLHFVRDNENPYGVVSYLMDAMAPGSYLAMSHATGDFDPASAQEGVRAYTQAGARFVPRTRTQFAAFFEGTQLLEPGIVQVPYWQPDDGVPPEAASVWSYGAVGRKTG